MNLPGALDTTKSALLQFADIELMMKAVTECVESSLQVAKILGETNARVQAVMHEHEHRTELERALQQLRTELELRKVQLEFATGKYGN